MITANLVRKVLPLCLVSLGKTYRLGLNFKFQDFLKFYGPRVFCDDHAVFSQIYRDMCFSSDKNTDANGRGSVLQKDFVRGVLLRSGSRFLLPDNGLCVPLRNEINRW